VDEGKSQTLLGSNGSQNPSRALSKELGEQGNCVFVEWQKMRVLAGIRVFGSLWANPRPNKYGATPLELG